MAQSSSRTNYDRVVRLKTRFCLECKNFEDRSEIDGNVVCAKNHRPGVSCDDFRDKFINIRAARSKTRFCLECENFEDRGEIDGAVLCAKLHCPGVRCEDFDDRLSDIFYSYLYWAYLYNIGGTDLGVEHLENRFSRKLSNQELAYACLLEYFELGLEASHFHKCWKTIGRIYEERLPAISKIFDTSLQRFDLYGERTNFRRVFLDSLLSKKTSEEVIKEVSQGLYKMGS